jgi:thermostable 8-oxoguanine DNA glycosylase
MTEELKEVKYRFTQPRTDFWIYIVDILRSYGHSSN